MDGEAHAVVAPAALAPDGSLRGTPEEIERQINTITSRVSMAMLEGRVTTLRTPTVPVLLGEAPPQPAPGAANAVPLHDHGTDFPAQYGGTPVHNPIAGYSGADGPHVPAADGPVEVAHGAPVPFYVPPADAFPRGQPGQRMGGDRVYLPPRSRYANNSAEPSLAEELEKVKTRLDALERTVNRKVAAGTILGALLGGLLGGAFARRRSM